ncbi:MAG: enoyl-CoA hydratase/isomerase family protein [Burkholderiales bacterium]|nr:enoyl-CoA hydratase/isomerase family protein [Burkholderiales bacterium]
MTYENLRVHRSEGVGWLEYRRAPRNAFDWGMLREVPVALYELLDAEDVRVIVFASAIDGWFSSGADLKTFQGMTPEDVGAWVTTCHSLVRQMRAATKPLLAAIHGTAVGGGLEIVLHCDVRFAAAAAKLGQPEVNIGFIPPVGGTQALARLLGRPRALRLLYEGGLVSAQEALAIGLVDIVVPDEDLRGRVTEYAVALTRKPATTLAAIRRCVTEGLETSMEAGLQIEYDAAVALGRNPNFAEGVNAFLAKRAPEWK